MKSLSLFLFLFLSHPIFAQLRLPDFISGGMVLQQQKTNRIWGWADAQQLVTVAFKGKNYPAFANGNGEWQVFLEPCKAGKAGDIIVSTKSERIELKDVLIGEVWICSGQSNMEWTMGMFGDTYLPELKTAQQDNIRFVTIRTTLANQAKQNVGVARRWSPVDTTSLADCSALAYWYAKALNQKLNVPIGLIISSWGGTPAQSWTSFEGLHDFPGYTQTFVDAVQPLDLDQIDQQRQRLRERFLQGFHEKSTLLKSAISPDFDDSAWSDMFLPKEWEEQGYPALDGVVLYRIAFTVAEADAGKEAELNLPAVDDMDSTYLNGVFIGSINQWDALRQYKIPAGVLKPGKNILAIQVQDDGGGGGLSAREDKFNVVVAGKTIPLTGKAKYEIIAVLEDLTGGNGALEHQPAVLFNAMIAPLLPLAIRGVIWYQGESNTERAIEYRSLFPAMVKDWRNRWGQGDFPFLFVQIASFGPLCSEPGESDWALLREAQTQTLALPNTAMAVTVDIGNPVNIHPHQKKEAGERLADQAMRMVYGKTGTISSGPQFKRMQVQGNQAIVEFSDTGSGLMVKGPQLKAFAIAGADKKFVWAKALVQGKRVVVSSAKVKNPVAVRYAWADSPVDANLYNKEGYPAIPFRSDVDAADNPVIAHRGVWKTNKLPQNSLASLRAAIALGCAGSEFDVRMTADDSLIINHDPDYHKLPIEKTNYADLIQFDLPNGEKLPTLRSYILAGMDNNSLTKLICEIKPSETDKARGKAIAAKVVRLIQELKAGEMVVYISFDYDILKTIRSLDPKAATQYLEGDKSPLQLKTDGISGADFHFSVYREHPDWIPMTKKNNIQLNAWTVNEPADMEWLLDERFDAITTNEPELLLILLKKRRSDAAASGK